MAQLARITGRVTFTEYKNGEFDGKPWGFWEATLLVGGRQTVPVRLNDQVRTPDVDQDVDYLIEVVPGRGENVKFRAISDYPATVSL